MLPTHEIDTLTMTVTDATDFAPRERLQTAMPHFWPAWSAPTRSLPTGWTGARIGRPQTGCGKISPSSTEVGAPHYTGRGQTVRTERVENTRMAQHRVTRLS